MDGIINVYKPAGMSSFSCVKKVSRLLGEKKAGHGGTLDPQATGILPVFLGKATKMADFIHEYDKSYRAGFVLGKVSDSYDIWGNCIQSADSDMLESIKEDQIRRILKSFIGECIQVPPAYSAIKINGTPAYKLARAGKEVEIKSRVVNIFTIELISYDNETKSGIFDVSCSKGTYVRSICHDLGAKLGCGACMCSLERTSYGPFYIQNSCALEECSEQRVLSCDFLLQTVPVVELNDEDAKKYASGNYKTMDIQNISQHVAENIEYLRIYNKGTFFALAKAEYVEGQDYLRLTPFKFFG